jgi:hypothetical protein
MRIRLREASGDSRGRFLFGARTKARAAWPGRWFWGDVACSAGRALMRGARLRVTGAARRLENLYRGLARLVYCHGDLGKYGLRQKGPAAFLS